MARQREREREQRGGGAHDRAYVEHTHPPHIYDGGDPCLAELAHRLDAAAANVPDVCPLLYSLAECVSKTHRAFHYYKHGR